MKLIFTSYVSVPEYDHPEAWLDRIRGYTGILESLAKTNTVIGIERINYEGTYEKNGVRYFFIRLKNKVTYFPKKIHQLIRRLDPDVVFINGFIFPLQIIQLKLRSPGKVKIIIIHRSEKPGKGIKKYLQQIADKFVDAYWFTSAESGKKWIERGQIGNEKKIFEILPNSSTFHMTDKYLAKNRLGLTGSPVFLWVGRLDANKDPLTVINAFTYYLDSEPDARLYMIYQTEELLEQVRYLVSVQKKCMKAIHLVGSIPHHELQDWYNSADFIISGSHYEGSGVAIVEAMSCGCIPVITDIPSFKKILGPENYWLLYPPGNKEELSKVLLKTRNLDIEKERARIALQFKNELSFEAIALKLNSIMYNLRKSES